MPSDPMTLIERLRNPAWSGSGLSRGLPALNVKRTVTDMAEAANEIEELRRKILLLENMPGFERDKVMARSIPWRVRVRRATETWVEVQASSAVEAEAEAAKVPGVIGVFGRSAMRGDESAVPEHLIGVRDE